MSHARRAPLPTGPGPDRGRGRQARTMKMGSIVRLCVMVSVGSLRLTHPTFGLDFIFLFRVFTLWAMLFSN